MTRPQEHILEQFALVHGRACVTPPDEFGQVRVTVPSGRCVLITPGGQVVRQRPDFGVRWKSPCCGADT